MLRDARRFLSNLWDLENEINTEWMSLGRSKRQRQYFTGPKRAEQGRFGCIGMSKSKQCLPVSMQIGESSELTMHLRGRRGNALNSEHRVTQRERSSCGSGRVHQASLPEAHGKYSLSPATSLALNLGTLAASPVDIETQRVCEHSGLWKRIFSTVKLTWLLFCALSSQ